MTSYIIEYMKAHLIGLMQDLEELEGQMEEYDINSKDYAELDFEFNNISGQINGVRHILQVAEEHNA